MDNRIITQYLATALWSSSGDDGESFDTRYNISDISRDSYLQVEADCKKFLELAGDLLKNWDAEQIGHDFWLSRNGHGTGFFDRTELADKETRDKLQDIARSFGEVNVMAKNKSFFWIT